MCLLFSKKPIEVFLGEKPDLDKRSLCVYAALFAVCMLVVFHVIEWWWMLAAVILILLVYERRILLKADFYLLATFVCFFVFAGNLTRIEAVSTALKGLLGGHELLVGAAVSQVISNVPAALLLSGFTDNARALLLGVDIGGLGTPIASLASLISLKLYSHAEGSSTGTFLLRFTLVNIALLIILIPLGLALS